jgi:hypothetical protein
MNSCPCCSNQLLRHIRHQGIYWFCTSCWQEMPNLDSSLKNDEVELHLRLKQVDKNQFSWQYINPQLFSSTSKTVSNISH